MSLLLSDVSTDGGLLFSEEDKKFLSEYQNHDVSSLALHSSLTARQKELLQQIAHRQKIQDKLPLFFGNADIFFPPQISLEQSSSEATAKYKSTLLQGHTLIDLTAGMGIDAFFIGMNFQECILVEKDETLANITSHNLALLKPKAKYKIAKGISAEVFLNQYNSKADCIYIDPARRNAKGGKVFTLQDCSPDVQKLLPAMLKIASRILIKLSPVLDIHLACETLPNVKHVYVLEHQGECKELLLQIEEGFNSPYAITAVNLDRKSEFTFYPYEEKSAGANYCLPQKYLYEPEVSIRKAGAFNLLSSRFGINKLYANSHLYTSNEICKSFPGRKFEILAVVKPDKKEILKHLKSLKANLTVRNFPDTVAQLRKKWGLADGGFQYLFATTLLENKKAVIIAERVKD